VASNENGKGVGQVAAENGTENESPQQVGSKSTERDPAEDARQVSSEPEPTKARSDRDDGNEDPNGWNGPGGVLGI
jgi:hypothetical protein